LHLGAKLRVPVIFKFITKYITPTLLLALLIWFFVEDWLDIITMKGVPPENIPYVLGIRLVLVGILLFLAIMVWIAWKRHKSEDKAKDL